ncbi:MAG: molybdenum cofactor guanylyltransferase [Halanaeroarchaeum sp.]
MRTAVVLAGGFATRFDGRDKAVVEVAGRPMIRRVVDAVAQVVDEVVVNARTDQRDAIESALAGRPDYRFAFDDEPDRGPLAGMATGLAATTTEWSAVVACDMPLVDPAFVDYLFSRASDHDAAIPVHRDDGRAWPQPLQAVYRTETVRDRARETLAAGGESPMALLDALDWVGVSLADAPDGVDETTLWNVNTVEDLRAVEARVARRTGE